MPQPKTRALRALRAFLLLDAVSEPEATGFDEPAQTFGGRAADCLGWVVTVIAVVLLIFGLTLSLASSYGG